MTSQRWAACSAVAGVATVGLACLLALGSGLRPPLAVPPLLRGAAPPVLAIAPGASPMPAQAQQQPAPPSAGDGYYEQLRSRLRWVQTRIGSDTLLTPDLRSRMLLAKSAARRARLDEVGLSFMDVYGIINAETSWVPRLGASKDGTPNLGIAQFEPATARALGLRNPNDPVEAIHAAALHMKEAAIWSENRLDGLKLSAVERAEKLREGVSIYYNLSSRGRAAWNGRNTRQLPRETQLHILNARIGAREAALAEAQLRAASFRRANDDAVLTAGDLHSGG
ncbi:hypothetical protein [Ramlibacter sp.]|uniref:hypothetical protein n=1 Tax=Ramlibacter sp. TaxID=1917967 RepID=UPI002CC68DA8|nr:hypothetical protein [Ramlibacter sp.]HWI81317.1 hypothetical protein [Ramlibacter sp.]